MSKITAAALCLGAAGGAAVTAVLMRQQQAAPPQPPAPHSQASAATASKPGGSLVDPAGLFRYGFPGPVSDMRSASSLVSAYDRRTRNPAWVAEHITPQSLATKSGDRSGSTFFEDDSIPAMFRAKLSDYFRSGYDRGHQVPAADAKWSQQAMDDTFALSNMCPQVGEGFNRDYWAHFEDFGRRLVKKYPSVRIVTGPLYLPKKDDDGKWRVSYEVIGSPPNVAVPTHFYKVFYAESVGPVQDRAGAAQAPLSAGRDGAPVALAAFVLPNARIPNSVPLKHFEVPIEMVEKASGLQFTTLLPPKLRRSLCAEVDCSILVREYPKRDGKKRQ